MEQTAVRVLIGFKGALVCALRVTQPGALILFSCMKRPIVMLRFLFIRNLILEILGLGMIIFSCPHSLFALDATITVDPGTVLSSNINGFGWIYETGRHPNGGPWNSSLETEFRNVYGIVGTGGFSRVTLESWMIEPFNDDSDPWNAKLDDGFAFSVGWSTRPEVTDINSAPYYSEVTYADPDMTARTLPGDSLTDYDWIRRNWDGLEAILRFTYDNNIDVMLGVRFIGRSQFYHPTEGTWFTRYAWLAETQYGETHPASGFPNWSQDDGPFAPDVFNDDPYIVRRSLKVDPIEVP